MDQVANLDKRVFRSGNQLPMPRVIGITGGLGMGKTTVSNYLKATYNLPILDADIYARQAVESGSQVFDHIQARYGSAVLLPTGAIDRTRLGDIVFNNPAERHWLEQQIHPYVRDRMEQDLQALADEGHQVAVLVIPLLFEARMTDLISEIWVIRSDQEQQIERLQQRDRLNLAQIQARIGSQMPIERKVEQADFVLDNSSTPDSLFQQIDRIMRSVHA